MLKDLTHNSIIRETMTDRFKECVDTELVPLLEERFADTLLELQMYEDYISDAFVYENEYYYPLTVLVEDRAPLTVWVKWRCGAGLYENGNPYAYIGEEPIGFELAASVPSEFTEKLLNRAIYADAREMIPVRVSTTLSPVTLLSGKYSQTFVDELARQITLEIERLMCVRSVAGSGLRLELVFSPETYMEHTSENVTYRRLLLTDGTRAVRDFWVRWERLDSTGAASVSDHVTADTCRFTVGEDASQKIREREYRFLIRENADKYRFAMGKRNVTEWRDLVKKMIKRGLLERVTPLVTEPERPAVSSASPETSYTAPEASPAPTEEDELMAQLSAIVGRAPTTEDVNVPEPEYDEEYERALRFAKEQVENGKSAADEQELRRRERELAAERERLDAENRAREQELHRTIGNQVKKELDLRERERMEVEARRAVIENARREQINRRAEEERRRADAAEAELRDLREAMRRLDEERERLAELRRVAEEETSKLTEIRRLAEEEEAKRREEHRLEKERLAEEARTREELRLAEEARLAEQEEARRLEELRIEAERKAEEERRREEEERRRLYEAEELRRIEAERLEKERLEAEKLAKEEEERRRIEIEVRLEYERRRREEEARLEAQRRHEEERARLEAIKRREEERRREEAARIEAEHRAEIERLVEEHRRAQEAARIEEERHRQEAARLEEARRHAEEYKRRAEEEARREFERHRQEAARLAEERERAEQAHREQQSRQEELERREELERERREQEHEAELARLAEAARIEEERLRERARADAEAERARAEAAVVPKENAPREYTYTAKMVHLIFRGAVDPNVIGRIQMLMNETIEYFGKETVPISVRAMITDSKTVDLDFVRIPEEEMPLLINIIKVLGNSELGIAKIVLD